MTDQDFLDLLDRVSDLTTRVRALEGIAIQIPAILQALTDTIQMLTAAHTRPPPPPGDDGV